MITVRRDLSTAEVERLFLGAVDEALSPQDTKVFNAVLEENAELKQQFAAYKDTVMKLKTQPREKAPDGLASMILRRTRRRRVFARVQFAELHRVPAEVLVPVLIGAAVALYFLLNP